MSLLRQPAYRKGLRVFSYPFRRKAYKQTSRLVKKALIKSGVKSSVTMHRLTYYKANVVLIYLLSHTSSR